MGKTTLNYLEIPTLDGGVEILDMRDFVSKEELDGSVSKKVEMLNSTISSLSSQVKSLSKDVKESKALINSIYNYFYIESIEDNNEVTFFRFEIWTAPDCVEYSLDRNEWKKLETRGVVTLNRDERVYLRCIKEYSYYASQGNQLFMTTKGFNVGGIIDSVFIPYNELDLYHANRTPLDYLLNGTYVVDAKDLVILSNRCSNMFENCRSLVCAPKSLSKEVGAGGYSCMFRGCTSLISAPELPALKLQKNCYFDMFNGCTSLVNAPKLPATTMAEGCYQSMFRKCSSLVDAPELPATILAEICYETMFWECTSLTNAPKLPATILAEYCYSRMFDGCSSLTTAPELPAATSDALAYSNMFNGCRKLSYIKCLDTDSLYRYMWVEGVSPTGTFVKSSLATNWEIGANGIPEGWTIQDYAE